MLFKKIKIGLEAPAKPSSTAVPPKRRRIPINIVEPMERGSQPPKKPPQTAHKTSPKFPVKANVQSDFLKPVSSRPLTSTIIPVPSPTVYTTQPLASKPPPPPMSAPKPGSFKDAKQARDSTKHSRVGGGIFRASGDSTIFNMGVMKTAQLSNHGSSEDQVKIPPFLTATDALSTKSPMTLFDFTNAWEPLSMEGRWQLVSVCHNPCFTLIYTHVITLLPREFPHPVSPQCSRHLLNRLSWCL